MRKYNVCFFASVRNRELLQLIQWYRNDIRILESISRSLKIATNPFELPLNADLYFAWWPTRSIVVLLLAKLLHKPVVIVAGGSEVINAQAFGLEHRVKGFYSSQPSLFKGAIKICLRHADRTLVVSRHLKEQVEALGGRNVDVIYHGIDTAEFSPNSNANRKYVFTISHLNQENIARKCIHTILEAIPYVLRERPDQRFVIAGRHLDGYEGLMNKVRALNIERNVEFPGKISNEQKLAYFRRSLVYVQPTLHEAFGVAIAEAMACGVPVITSPVAAVPEVVGDTGLYVDPKNPIQLAEKILLLLNNHELWEKLSRKGRERIVRSFSFENRKERMAELIETLVQKT